MFENEEDYKEFEIIMRNGETYESIGASEREAVDLFVDATCHSSKELNDFARNFKCARQV